MSTVQRIAKNTTVLLVAQVASYLLAFFYMMYIARYLGPASFGILSFALAFTGIFAIFGDLGLGLLTVREVARDKSLAPKYLANVGLMKIILAAVTFGLIALIINLMGYPAETIRVVYFIGLHVVLAAFAQMFYSIFQAFERMEFQAISQMLNAALILGGVIFAIKYGLSVVGFASLYVIASAIVLCYSFAVMKLKFPNPVSASVNKAIEFDWSFWKPTIKEALPFGLTAISISLYLWIDSVMLSIMKGDAVVGWYNAAYRLVLALLFIPVAFNSAIFPLMSQLYVSSENSLKLILERHFKYMLTIGIPIGVGITILADRIVLLIFGTGYIASIIALQVLCWAAVFVFARAAFERLLGASNRQATVAKVFGSCALLNIILNLILIPKYNYIGASIATLVTDIAVFIILYARCARIGYRVSSGRLIAFAKIIGAAALMGTFIQFSKHLNLSLLLIAAIIIYFGIVLGTKALDKEDLKLLRDAINWKKVN